MKRVRNKEEVPTAGVDYACTRSEQAKEEEKAMPIIEAKNNKAR